jgi:hypothetical protein
VRDSDGSLVLTRGRPSGGTALTIALARRHGRALLVLDLERGPDPAEVQRWAEAREVAILNVAGPRESQQPGIRDEAYVFLEEALKQAAASRP